MMIPMMAVPFMIVVEWLCSARDIQLTAFEWGNLVVSNSDDKTNP